MSNAKWKLGSSWYQEGKIPLAFQAPGTDSYILVLLLHREFVFTMLKIKQKIQSGFLFTGNIQD